MERRVYRLFAALATTAVVATTTLTGATGHAAEATSCPLGLTATATQSPVGGAPYTVCSGRVPSFDGTPLDVDVSIPVGATGPLPLVVMLSGWGTSKTQLESTTLAGNGANTWDWNNAWFASRGFAVVNFTPRGFYRSCGQDPASGYTYANDPACAGRASWTHLADLRWEVHDTQFLTGRLVDAGVASPTKVTVTGDSYGGGQSWLLAMGQNRVMQPDGTTVPWTSPAGTPIRLAAAVPQYTWTDLSQALLDNGRASDRLFGAPVDGPHENPIGVEKESYVDGLYALGQQNAQYATSNDPTADLPGWYAAISAGEPYETNPTVGPMLSQLQTYRSPYYLPVPSGSAQVPVLSIQGTTDPLFPGVHTIQMVNRLQSAHSDYPVWAFYGDLGHSYADNPHAVWTAANDEANAWLSQVIAGAAPTAPRTTLATTACVNGQNTATLTANRFSQLATTKWSFTSGPSAVTTSGTIGGPEATALDPITNSGCRTTAAQSDPGVASWTFTPPSAGTITGSPVVHVTVTLDGSNAEVAARLFDANPASGTQTLITRAVYRITGSPGRSLPLAFELWPAGWQVQSGHQLKLELTQGDAPTWRPDNETSSLAFSGLQLTVPLNPS
ncbi:CocE/NonD family hydrolase C-terminal non-catalytic domain-containing protein [Streptomyces sp. NPDC003710]